LLTCYLIQESVVRKISLVILTSISLTSFAGSLNDKYERINRIGSQLDRIEQKIDLLLQNELKIERSIDKVKANTKNTYNNAKEGVSEGVNDGKEFIEKGVEKARDGISKGLDWLSDNIKSPSQ